VDVTKYYKAILHLSNQDDDKTLINAHMKKLDDYLKVNGDTLTLKQWLSLRDAINFTNIENPDKYNT